MSAVSGRFLSASDLAGLASAPIGRSAPELDLDSVDLESVVTSRHAAADPNVAAAAAVFTPDAPPHAFVGECVTPVPGFDPTRVPLDEDDAEGDGPAPAMIAERPTLCGSLVYDKVITAVGEMVDLESPDKIFLRGSAEMFHTRFMGRDQRAIADSLFAAEQFFAERYGLDFSRFPFGGVDAQGRPDPAKAGIKETKEAVLFGYILNPSIDLRVYTTSDGGSGILQPRGSQKVIAGGWAVRLTSPLQLRGSFAAERDVRQITYPAGTMLLHGDYLVRSFAEKTIKETEPNVANPDGPPVETVKRILTRIADDQTLQFRSRTPITPTGEDLLLPLDHVIEHASLGTGVASGTLRAVKEGHARWRVEMTETWKFPGELIP